MYLSKLSVIKKCSQYIHHELVKCSLHFTKQLTCGRNKKKKKKTHAWPELEEVLKGRNDRRAEV